jgi:FtsZ-binding cell division protein ZapB
MEKLEGNNHHLHTQLSEQLNEQKKHNSKVELNRELTRAAADVTRVTRDCTELHRQIKELKAKLENEKRERTLREKEMGEMTASILRMTREKTELEASRDSTIRIEIQTLRGQNQDLSTSKDNLESEHHELQYNYRCLAGAFGDLQESHEKMSEENKSLKSALALANSDRYTPRRLTRSNNQHQCDDTNPSTSDDAPTQHKEPITELAGQGLVNAGSTCHMNCVIQALANIPDLTTHFLNEDFTLSNQVQYTEVGERTLNHFCWGMYELQKVVASVGLMERPLGKQQPYDTKDLLVALGTPNTQEDITEVRTPVKIMFPPLFPLK